MPEVSKFLGIVIGMFYRDHGVALAVGVNTMDYHVVEARYVGGHVVWLRFRDGTSGEIDLGSVLEGPVFEPLHDPAVFRDFQIHPEFHTLVWANGADVAPEFLHQNIRITA